ncbi:MAG: hypothetical protein BGO21_28675 [Dyadobacter sp. 50-39]|uniref:hypothetical protein n=1 Tax=Dyadobacter sp. 50-39 TaxID=1895756 RepID=UPI00095F16FD|nr:hypothetical protein [Dyadobacter sp. 50-39]OJV16834.1 MAG: hypothetical protein BGO21_28675 [Dyadobacter sp. 50-39]
MHTEKDIQFDKLIAHIRGLSDHQRRQLKAELDRIEATSPDYSLEEFLLAAPTFSENQLKTIEETRKAIDQWRKN